MNEQDHLGRDAEREAADNKLVDDAYQQLIESYLSSPHRKKVDIINKAFNFARQAHKGVRRLSGEPYIMHPIAVAMIVSKEMGLGSTSICSALLHDVVEDTDYTVEDIETIFGSKIAQIVDGLTKISGGIFGDKASAQAANFKKLLLTMSDDIRVILIKICDRLHNMRTLSSQPANKQYKIAGETLYIYAPLANRLGLNKIKNELEDLSFKYEHPEEYDSIKTKLASTEEKRNILFEEFTTPIRAALDKMGMKYVILARVKTPYSIWSKMQNKNVTFDEIYDILAVRIIFKPESKETEINDCFKIYVAINKIYKSHPERLRDWVNHPKANGYQALHVTLMSKQGQWIEVQIRSERMDDIAEQGFAAHWKYKQGEDGRVTAMSETGEDGELNDWLHTIKEILDDPQPDAMDFLDTIKLNLFASEIFVFTPKGEICTMPAGSTALDFAFQIHTFLGSHCIGAKVNHKLVPLSHRLNSGDQVEILSSKTQHVNASWVNFATTAKAKTKILAILRPRHGDDHLGHRPPLCFPRHRQAREILPGHRQQEHHPGRQRHRRAARQQVGQEVGLAQASALPGQRQQEGEREQLGRRRRHRPDSRRQELQPQEDLHHQRQQPVAPHLPAMLPPHSRRRHPGLHRQPQPHRGTPSGTCTAACSSTPPYRLPASTASACSTR